MADVESKGSFGNVGRAGGAKAADTAADKVGDMKGDMTSFRGTTGKNIIYVLFMVLPSFYLAWYVAAITLSAAFGIRGSFFIITFLEPFDHINFSPVIEGGQWRPLVHWLSMIFAMAFAGPWLIYFACRPKRLATDASTAVNSLHFFLCTTITQQTPENWIWWATFMACGVFMGRTAEFMIARIPMSNKRRWSDGNKKKTTPYST